MTEHMEVMIHLPMIFRVWWAIWALAFAAGMVGVAVGGDLGGIPFLIVPGFLAQAIWRQRVCTDGDTLHVRNFVVDHVYDRASVIGFSRVDALHLRQHSAPSLFGGKLAAHLDDGRTLMLMATQRGPFGRWKLERMRADFERWRQAANG